MTYRTKDGVKLPGSTAVEVITALRDEAFMYCSDLGAYIQKTARFSELHSGKVVRGDTAENLLADLIGAGLIMKGEK